MKPSSTTKAPRLLSVQAVAAYLDMSEKTVRRLFAKGDLPGHRIGRLRRISEADLRDFLLTHRGQATEANYGQY
jgi:excisionase family DNA binding protein